MKLLVDTKNEKFASVYIPGVLKDYVIKNHSALRSGKLDKYLKSIGSKYSVRTALIYAIDTLKVVKEQDFYYLEIDKNRQVPYSDLNLETMVKLITYGTVDIKGYDLLLKAFKFVNTKMKILKRIYAAKYEKKGE